MKFLEKPELPHFKFQKDFLRPFEHVMTYSNVVLVKDMALSCLHQMLLARGDNIRSGWGTMFGVFTTAAKESYRKLLVGTLGSSTADQTSLGGEPGFRECKEDLPGEIRCDCAAGIIPRHDYLPHAVRKEPAVPEGVAPGHRDIEGDRPGHALLPRMPAVSHGPRYSDCPEPERRPDDEVLVPGSLRVP